MNKAVNVDVCEVMCVHYDTHPYAVKKILQLQKYMPSYLVEKEDRIVANLKDQRNINIFLLNEIKEVVGYIIGAPQDEIVVGDFLADDPDMCIDPHRYYIDQVVAQEKYRKGNVAVQLLFAVFHEANKRGFYHFSGHSLCANGFDRIITRVLRRYITHSREVVLSRYGNTRYVYVDVTYP